MAKHWGKLFSPTIKNSCKNSLNIIEILLITPITKAKIERIFNCLLRVKTNWRNRFTNERLNHNLRVNEEGVSISDYDPENGIVKWYNRKVKFFKKANQQKHLEKRHKLLDGNSAVNVVAYVLSDFEEPDAEDDDAEETETFKLTWSAFIFCLWF